MTRCGDKLIRQILYTSKTTLSDTSVAAIDVLRVARRRNAEDEIGGFLVKDGGTFVQVIEGPADAIEQVFRRIRRDMRHYGIEVRSDRSIRSRQFGDWGMGFAAEPINAGDDAANLLARVIEIANRPEPKRRVEMAEAMARRKDPAAMKSQTQAAPGEGQLRMSGGAR
nr:BLUF domain-containing protein [Wenxinia saemankumensis]